MRVTRKGQVTIPLLVRRALGIQPGSDVEFELDEHGARPLVDSNQAAEEISGMRSSRRARQRRRSSPVTPTPTTAAREGRARRSFQISWAARMQRSQVGRCLRTTRAA
jgi:AbrB family looped-hinge helix DNA binding protein